MPDFACAAARREFANAASRLAGFAGVLFGWRPEEFWRATPAELGAVVAALQGDAIESLSASELSKLWEKYPDGGR